MSEWLSLLAVIILLTLISSLPRVFRGPTRADTMLSAQLCGTSCVAILLLLAHARGAYFLYDVALAFTLLATVSAVTFVRLAWYQHHLKKGEDDADS